MPQKVKCCPQQIERDGCRANPFYHQDNQEVYIPTKNRIALTILADIPPKADC